MDTSAVVGAMENEFEQWLKRYPVPTMVSAFDVRDDLLSVRAESRESHLMGYCDLQTGQIVKRWGVLADTELPPEQLRPSHLESVYTDIPFRDEAAVGAAAQRKSRDIVRAGRAIAFFLVAVPITIELLSFGIAWFGYLVMAVSIITGLYKAAKALGWLQPTAREVAKREEERKMQHYYWHCERNPEAFIRLKRENFDSESIEKTRDEAARLGVRRRE